QQPTETSAILVWYTTRQTPCTFTFHGPDGVSKTAPVESSGTHHVVRLDGLSAATRYTYDIASPVRNLKSALTLRTNKTAAETFKFVVFGDSGRGTQAQYRLGGLMAQARPDFIVHTGDLIYPDGERKF